MKIKIDVDVTPQELREFFGLPDVQPLQSQIMDTIREKMDTGAEGFDPITLMKRVVPQNLQAVEAVQKAFWDSLYGSKPDQSKE